MEPPRRELRYMLERTVACVHVDQDSGRSSGQDSARLSLDERLARFQIASRVFQNNVDEINRNILGEKEIDYRSSLKGYYSEMCRYVHPSTSQVTEQLRREEGGEGFGFESIEILRKTTSAVLRGLDLILAMAMHGIDVGTLGDLFVDVWDHEPRWAFHKTKFTKVISSQFDYKVERSQPRRR
jgi:hypothetical protein